MAETIEELAQARSHDEMQRLIDLALERGIGMPDVLVMWAELIANANPRLARLSLEAMEEAILGQKAA